MSKVITYNLIKVTPYNFNENFTWYYPVFIKRQWLHFCKIFSHGSIKFIHYLTAVAFSFKFLLIFI